MPNGFINQLTKWQRETETSWERLQKLELELTNAGETIPVWKKALLALPKVSVIGLIPKVREAFQMLESPDTTRKLEDYNLALSNYQQAAWFTFAYSATTDDLAKAGITSSSEFLQLHPPETGTSEADIAIASHYIDSLLGKVPAESPDEVAAAWITEPLETRPRFKGGIHSTTVEEMVKYLRREVPPPELPPSLEDIELLEFLKDQGYTEEEQAEAEETASSWITSIQEFEVGREQIRRYQAGLDTPGMPEESFGTKAKRFAVQPMLALMDIVQPYWTYWDYPRSAILTSAFAKPPFTWVPWIGSPPKEVADLDALYQKNRDAGMNHWMAKGKAWEDWEVSGWGKVGIEIVTDPVSYIGFGLGIKAAKALKGVPVIGRFAGLMGAAEAGFIRASELPFTGIKNLIGRMPKTVAQRSVFEGKQTGNTLIGYFEQRGGNSLRHIPQEDFTKYAMEAIDYRLANPQEWNWISQAGDEYVKRVPMSREVIMELGNRIGVKLSPDEITHATVESMEFIMENVNIIGSRFPFINKTGAAKEIANSIFNISDTPENVRIITSFMEDTYGSAIESGIKLAQLPKVESLKGAVGRTENLARIAGEEGLYEWKMRHGITAAIYDWIDPLVKQVWSNGIEKHLVMPFARSYLITGLYAQWNWFEEMGRSLFGRGGVLYGRNAPIRLADDVGMGLMYERAISEGADVARLGYKQMAKATTIPGTPMGWGEMTEAARLVEIERQAGKPFLEKLMTFAWLPKIGRRTSEIAYTPIRASALFGSMEKSGYTITRYYDELRNIAPDIVGGIERTFADPPVIPGMSKKTMDGLSQMAKDASFIGPDRVESVATRFTQRSIKEAEVHETLQKYAGIPGEVRDDLMELSRTGELWKDVPGHVTNARGKAAEEFIHSPEVATKRLHDLVDEVLAEPLDITTRESLLGFAKLLGDISNTSSESITRLFVGLHDKVSRLPSAAARKATYESGYKSIEPFLNAVDAESKRLVAHIRANVGDLLTDTEWRAVEGQIDVYLSRIAKLKETRVRAMEQANRMVAEGRIQPGTVEWYTEQNKIWGEFWKEDPKMFANMVVAGDVDAILNPQMIPKPIINASARGLTPADVGTLLYAPGDKLSYAMMNSELLMRKEYFVAVVQRHADVMALRASTSRQALGFTDDAIDQVYDQLIYGLRSRPEIHNGLVRVNAELDNLGRDLESIRINNSFDIEAERKVKEWLRGRADRLRELDVYKIKPPVVEAVPSVAHIKWGRGIVPDIQARITETLNKVPSSATSKIKGFEIDPGIGKNVIVTSKETGIITASSPSVITPRTLVHETGHLAITDELLAGWRAAYKDVVGIPVDEAFAESFALWIENPKTFMSRKLSKYQLRLFGSQARFDTAAPGLKAFFDVSFPPVKPPIVPPTIAREGSNAWWGSKQQAMDGAMKSFYKDFTDYTNLNMVDSAMRHIFPYWVYESQRWFWLPRNMVQHPGVANFLTKYQDNSEYGAIHVPGTNLSVNPLIGSVYKGGLSTLMRRDYPEYYDRYFPLFHEGMDYIQRWGFYPNVFWGLVVGATGGREPQFGELLPSIVSTPLDIFVAANPDSVPAKVLYEIVFPDRFRQYMQITEMHHLATNDQINRGINGEYIWSKMQRNEDLTKEENELYNQSVRNVALRNAWVEHASIFKLRHEDRLKAYEWFDKVKEEVTGVPVKMQEQLRRHGYTLGDVVPGLSQYDIMLVEEMDEYKRWITPRVTASLRPSNEIEDNLILSEFWGMVKQHSEDSSDMLNDIEYDVFVAGTRSRKDYRAALSEINKSNAEYIHELHGDKYNPSTGQWDYNPNSKSKFKMVPITAEQRAKFYADKGVNLSMSIFDEMLAEWFRLTVREKTDPETGIKYEDWGTYFATQNAIEKLMTPELKSQWDAYLKRNETPGRAMYRDAVDNYLVPYWAVDDVIKKELFSLEEQAIIDEYYLVRDIDPIKAGEMKDITRPDGTKLISQYTTSVANARKKLRMVIPMVDAQLLFWGYTTTTQTPEANELYQQLMDTARNYYSNI